VAGPRPTPGNSPGAHFLRDGRVADRLIRSARLQRGELVLDLGAGAGALTARLARTGARVVAVERDARLAARLRRRFEDFSHITVVEGDLLALAWPRRCFKVVSNPPFSATGGLVRALFDEPRARLQRAEVLLEWGAARRLCADVPSSFRAAWRGARFDLRVVGRVAPASFSPPPEVDVAHLSARRRPGLQSRSEVEIARRLLVRAWRRPIPIGRLLGDLVGSAPARRLCREHDIDPRLPARRAPHPIWTDAVARREAQMPPGSVD
jgi:16S rRNA A1518/A1519 N6-dimethyltransferase RsmA/KsgA/DIM1 with predicted DNA glycosylase/AP lyase activity